MTVIRGSCVAFHKQGILLRGDSGAGKSDLALRLVDSGAILVSDDYTDVENDGGVLTVTAPESLRGLLEVRGLGVLQGLETTTARLVAVIDLLAREHVERHPEPNNTEVLGVSLPCFRLAAFDASTVAKVRLAISIACGTMRRSP